MTSRITTTILAVAIALSPRLATAQTETAPDPRAEALNDEGKASYKAKDWATAAEKFRAAISVQPDARYYFNLCATLEKLGDLDAALEACDNVYNYDPKDDLKAKTGQRAAEIRQKKRAVATAGGGTGGGNTGGGNTDGGGNTGGGNTGGGNTGGGNTGDGSALPPYAGGGAPGDPYTQIEAEPDPREKYSWSLGVDLGIARNNGVGREDMFSDGGQMFRMHADFLVAPKPKIGVQAYIDVSLFNRKDDVINDEQLTIVDVGAALFWHRKITPTIYFTPLAGAHLTGLQPYRNADESFGTFGFRFDAGFHFVLGSGGHHVITFTPSLNLYLPAASQTTGDMEARIYGFDHGGTTLTFAIGYTYRFTKGFFPGLVVLE